MGDLPTAAVVAVAGLAGGIVLGLAARLGRFCTLAVIEDAIFAADYRQLSMWALAMAIAMTGVAVLSHAGLIDIAGSLYHR
jgi:hypothetical protein